MFEKEHEFLNSIINDIFRGRGLRYGISNLGVRVTEVSITESGRRKVLPPC